MKFLIVFVALFAFVVAAPPRGHTSSQDAQVLRFESDVQPDGFKYGLETSDGTVIDASGQLKKFGPEEEAVIVHGSYKYIGDDGVTYEVKYVADENGYQPQGAHLPVAPQA